MIRKKSEDSMNSVFRKDKRKLEKEEGKLKHKKEITELIKLFHLHKQNNHFIIRISGIYCIFLKVQQQFIYQN